MVPTGVLTGQIMMVFATVLLGLWSATQWTAAALGYQMRLGAPWFDLLGTPIYHPWKLFECHRRVQRLSRCHGGRHHVGVARAAVQAGHDLRFGTLGAAG